MVFDGIERGIRSGERRKRERECARTREKRRNSCQIIVFTGACLDRLRQACSTPCFLISFSLAVRYQPPSDWFESRHSDEGSHSSKYCPTAPSRPLNVAFSDTLQIPFTRQSHAEEKKDYANFSQSRMSKCACVDLSRYSRCLPTKR